MLQTFLYDLSLRPFRWGETDCALVIADWWRLNHGVDPAASLRGRYASEGECAAILAAHGHLPRLMARLCREAGAERTRDPVAGDFGVLRLAGRWWGGIKVSPERWAIKPHDGIAITANVRVVAAWRV